MSNKLAQALYAVERAEADYSELEDWLDECHREFGRQIRRTRKVRKISLRAFAERLKVSPAFLSDVERGRRTLTDERRDAVVRALGGAHV